MVEFTTRSPATFTIPPASTPLIVPPTAKFVVPVPDSEPIVMSPCRLVKDRLPELEMFPSDTIPPSIRAVPGAAIFSAAPAL